MYRNIDNTLTTNKELKAGNLDLSFFDLKGIPDLREYEWVKTLSLRANQIVHCDIRNLPPFLVRLNLSTNSINEFAFTPNDPFENISKDNVQLSIFNTLQSLDLENNNLSRIDLRMFKNLKKLEVSHNDDLNHSLVKLPSCLEELDISHCKLTKLPECPDSLMALNCSFNNLAELNDLNQGLLMIDFSGNDMVTIPELPDSISLINCSNSNFTEDIEKLPPNLESLVAYACDIKKLSCVLPGTLTFLDLTNNSLDEMPDLPNSIETVKLSSNLITDIKTIPPSVKKLSLRNNYISTVPDDLLKRDDLTLKLDGNFVGLNQGRWSGNFKLEADENFPGVGRTVGSRFNQQDQRYARSVVKDTVATVATAAAVASAPEIKVSTGTSHSQQPPLPSRSLDYGGHHYHFNNRHNNQFGGFSSATSFHGPASRHHHTDRSPYSYYGYGSTYYGGNYAANLRKSRKADPNYIILTETIDV